MQKKDIIETIWNLSELFKKHYPNIFAGLETEPLKLAGNKIRFINSFEMYMDCAENNLKEYSPGYKDTLKFLSYCLAYKILKGNLEIPVEIIRINEFLDNLRNGLRIFEYQFRESKDGELSPKSINILQIHLDQNLEYITRYKDSGYVIAEPMNDVRMKLLNHIGEYVDAYISITDKMKPVDGLEKLKKDVNAIKVYDDRLKVLYCESVSRKDHIWNHINKFSSVILELLKELHYFKD